jgi:hypothetical protein
MPTLFRRPSGSPHTPSDRPARGIRSAQATQLMEQAGLEVADAGSMQQAADATGLPIVQ